MPRSAVIAAILTTSLSLAASENARTETLDEAWSEALARNSQLAAVAIDASAAQDDLQAARSGRRPSVWGRSSYAVRSDESSFRFDNPLLPGETFVEPFRQREGAGTAAAVSIPLYAGGRISNSIGGAEARLTAAHQATAMSRMNLFLDVGEAYVAVLRSQRQLEVARQNLHGMQAHQAEVQRHFDQSQVPQTDLLAAQVAVSTAQQVELKRLHRLEMARGEFNRLLGRPLNEPVELEEVSMPRLAYSCEQLKAIALQKRPDIAEMQATADARRFEAERLKASTRPQVSAIGRHDFEENRYQTPQGIASAAVVVEWNLYDGGQSQRTSAAELSRAMSLLRMADDLRSRISLDILNQWNFLHEASSRLQVALQSVEHADENLRVSQLRFLQGATVSSEVLDAQTQRSQVASELYDAAYDCCLAGLRIRYASGILGNGE